MLREQQLPKVGESTWFVGAQQVLEVEEQACRRMGAIKALRRRGSFRGFHARSVWKRHHLNSIWSGNAVSTRTHTLTHTSLESSAPYAPPSFSFLHAQV